MKKLSATLSLPVLALALCACSSTWHGVKEDTHRNKENVEAGVETGWDKTKGAVRKGTHAVGEGMSHVGEKIQNATE